MQIVILGRDGQVLGANMPGEVALRGPSVFSGYGGGGPAAEAANLEAFEGGWFHTGDEVGQGGWVAGAGRRAAAGQAGQGPGAGAGRAGSRTAAALLSWPGPAAARSRC